jgi:hypothetical protein
MKYSKSMAQVLAEMQMNEKKSLNDLKKILDRTTLLTPKEKKEIQSLEKKMDPKGYQKILSRMFSEEQEDPVQKAQDKLDKAKKIADLKKQIDTVRQEGKMSQMHMMIKQKKTPEQIAKALKLDLNTVKALMKEAVDPQDTGGAAEVDMIMNQVTQMRHFLDGIEKMVQDDGDVEEWVQGKITKATDYLKTAYSYKTGEKNEALDKEDEPAVKKLVKNLRKGSKTHAKQADELEKDLKDETDLEEFKKMVVTIKDPSKRRKAMDDIKRFGKRTGFRIDKMRDGKSFKIDGKGADLNKFATDLKNYYGAEIKAESYEPLEEFTDKQIERLRKEYEDLRGKETGINPEKFKKLRGMMKRFPKENLLKLVKADIPILTTGAKAALVMYHGMKWKQLPEDFLPYIDLFADDNQEISEAKKGKFKEVDPKVVDRIEKMMNGTRQEKDSIANMLNYLMPPEVVDMVRYKLKIVPKRGKIKFR